jgi:lipopolysaccharide/colanic/teichoic acid biosynthesis glycosyltransferase
MECRYGQGVRIFKRATDIAIAVIGLAVLAALFIPVAFGIKLTSPGPIIYRQVRVGTNRRSRHCGEPGLRQADLGGKPFVIFKFRSMAHVSSDEARLCQPDDPRVTAFGALLRRTHLDEFPQFWNVLKGDMSFVGPRPEQAPLSQRYVQTIPAYSTRTLCLRPGITGLAQITTGYTLTLEDVERAAHLDHQYAASLQSMWACARTDARLATLTVLHIVRTRRRGAERPEEQPDSALVHQ